MGGEGVTTPAGTFRFGAHTFRAAPIDVEDARLMCRHLLTAAPHLRVLMPVERDAPAGLLYAGALSKALDAMPDADEAWIGSTCLSSLQRRSGLRWLPIWDARRRPLCPDMVEIEYFLLIVRVVHEVASEYLNEGVPA